MFSPHWAAIWSGMVFRVYLVSFLSLLIASPAIACSCLRAESAAAHSESYDLVFLGTVIDSGEARDPRSFWQRNWDWMRGRSGPDFRDTITTFQVDETFKGAPGRNIALRHLGGEYGATCGVSFPPGRQLVILAYPRAEGGYSTSLCAMAQVGEDEYRDALLD